MKLASVDSSLTRKFIESLVVALVFTGISWFLAISLGWITEVNPIEVAAVFTSYSCTYLCVVQSRWNYPMGIVSTVLLSITFLQVGLFASAALNAYLPFALLYGWLRWGRDEVTRPVTWLGLSGWWVPYLAITGTVFFGLHFLVTTLGGSLPIWDSTIVALSILAQLLLDNKRIETWIVWAIVNVLAIAVYLNQGLYFVGIQFVLFLANTVYAFFQWRSTINHARWYAVEQAIDDLASDQASS